MGLRAALLILASPLVALADDPGDRPSAASSDANAAAMTARIDALLEARWKAAGVEANAPATDAVFLRRASLDLTGAIPSVSEVRAFLADERPDRRARLIDSLLKKPSHATRLASHWRDAMLPRSSPQVRFGQTQPFEQWLRGKFADNAPYDALVRELLTTSGNLGQSAPVLYYTALDLKPEELAASTSKIFLGVQIACAQCHNHPFDVWTQRDFWGYAAFFSQLLRPPQQQQFIAVADTGKGEVKLPNTDTVVAPQFLGAAAPVEPTKETRRQQLAAWLTAKENPYFARAAVNRVWALLFGYGLVNPIDDFGKHNKPVDEMLLNELAADFSGHGHDLRRLFRILANTRAYGLSSETTAEIPDDPLLFSRMSVKSLTAEQIWDCVAEATCRREPAPNGAGTVLVQQSFQQNLGKQAFIAKFEAPTQGATEFQAGIPQALTMMNGTVINDATDLSKSEILTALLDSPFFENGDRIDVLFMATLTRLPGSAERTKFAAYLETGGPSNNRDKALADILWALLNSSEFILNH